jgi:SAM-dependent methyltransferase
MESGRSPTATETPQRALLKADAGPDLRGKSGGLCQRCGMTPERYVCEDRGVAAEWWPDEVVHAGAEHLDPEYVAAFDRKSPTDWSATLEALDELGLGSTSTVVDIGAGTGAFALAVRPHVGRVVAVDPSPAMVQLLEARGIEAVRGGFLTYEHDGGQVDLVHSRNALHHLPDFWKALALERVAQILKLGGAFIDLVYTFSPSEATTVIERWLDGATADSARGWTRAELEQHVRAEFSTFSWLLEAILDRVGFEITTRCYSESLVYASYVCRRT